MTLADLEALVDYHYWAHLYGADWIWCSKIRALVRRLGEHGIQQPIARPATAMDLIALYRERASATA